jgi:branched-chain amino acid transport system ATP-binding protein
MPLLQVSGLSMRFGGLAALDDVSFDVERGSVVSIIGPNGSGKSTTFNCINGILNPTEGAIHFENDPIVGLPPHQVARLGIARTFQNIELFAEESTVDNLMLGRHIRMESGLWAGLTMVRRTSRAAREEVDQRNRVEAILEVMGLTEVRERRVGELPYGTQKRVELGRALAMEPRLLLLDEPSAGMNDEEREDLTRRIRTLKDESDLTILLIEHHMHMAIGLADQVIALNFGRVIAEGDPETVRAHPEVVRAYLGDV